MQHRGRVRHRTEKKKEDAVEYSLGNETIIQPKHSRLKEMSSHLAVANIFIGAAIGAALIWFLIAPAVNQARTDRMNDQMREYSDKITSLEAQVSAQTRTLDNYRATGESVEADAQAAQTTRDSYEALMTVSNQYDSGEYSDATMADTLINVNRDSLGQSAQALYDQIAADIYPNACERNFETGTEALASQDYQGAIDAFYKVVRMDEGYNGGQALYNLAQAYQGNGDSENAATYYQRIVDSYSDSDYAADAQSALDAIG